LHNGRTVTGSELEGGYPETEAVMSVAERDGTSWVYRFSLWEEEGIKADDREQAVDLAGIIALNVEDEPRDAGDGI
jgi:hypothetical protein